MTSTSTPRGATPSPLWGSATSPTCLTAVAISVGARLPDFDGSILLLEEPRAQRRDHAGAAAAYDKALACYAPLASADPLEWDAAPARAGTDAAIVLGEIDPVQAADIAGHALDAMTRAVDPETEPAAHLLQTGAVALERSLQARRSAQAIAQLDRIARWLARHAEERMASSDGEAVYALGPVVVSRTWARGRGRT